MAKPPAKPKAPLLHQLAGGSAGGPPAPSGGPPDEGQGFIIEVLEAREEGGEIAAVESGRGRIIRASAKDAEILPPAHGSKHKRLRVHAGKFTYD